LTLVTNTCKVAKSVLSDTISIRIWENGNWNEVGNFLGRDQVEETVREYTDQGWHPYTAEGKSIMLRECFDEAVDGRRTVFLARNTFNTRFPDEL
jgi:hypothetical protein